jgi:hypothetical protein
MYPLGMTPLAPSVSYVNAPMAPVEECLQEIHVITDKLVEVNPGGYKLVCDLAAN